MASVSMALSGSVTLIRGTRREWSASRARCSAGALKQDVGFELKQGVLRFFHELPSGQRMEVLSTTRARESGQKRSTPLVFLHGSYHAAWCWAEFWLPYFAQAGYDCFALSLLGQGESDMPPDRVPRTLELHADDVADFIGRHVGASPVLVGHSFGGLIVQFYLSSLDDKAEYQRYPRLSAAVLACSVPPTGNTAVVMRFLRTRPLASLKVTYSLAAKGFARSLSLCRETFFSPGMCDADVQRYQTLIKQSSLVPLFDLKKLNASLPVGRPSPSAPPVLVIGSENDFILDIQAVEETASYYNAKQVILPDTAHDIMLDTRWKTAAEVVESWLSSLKV